MTWSIIAKDHETGLFGVAVATCDLAVGAICPCAEGRVGALCSQALPNPTWRTRGLELLRQGLAPQEVRDMLVRADEGAEHRQLHIIDSEGRIAGHTGDHCLDWCGHVAGELASVAGNMLAGAAVVEDTLAGYLENRTEPFVERLFEAMNAGEAAGGDKRGKQSAALLIQGPEAYPRLDIRVDDHGDPLVELRRLYEVAKDRFLPFSRAFPSAERPFGVTDRKRIESFIAARAGTPLTQIGDMPNDD
ncbi:MAG: DUF1028 domain-containing protein [Proteobacteria bacterium]|nr:DUF1028 domain-containing protein [Pseudomonadota bacterium]